MLILEGTPPKPPVYDQALINRILEENGGVAGFLDRMERFRKVVDRFHKEEEALTRKYPFKWVAVGKDGLLEVGDSLEEVCSACEARGLKNPDYWARFLDPDPKVMVL